MAHVYRSGKGWRAQVYCAGRRLSATRDTKAAALAWAAQQETEIRAGARGEVIARSVADALDQYSRTVSPTKRGAHWEQVRLAKLARTLPFRGMLCQDVRPADVAAWRDLAIQGGLPDGGAARPALVGASVRREMVLLRSVFEVARREWGYLTTNPMTGVRYPPHSPPRTRRVSDDEIARLLLACGWGDAEPAELTTQRVGVAILWALYTAMRAGELCGLTWADVSVSDRTATLPRTKNGEARAVPLSRAALALLPCLPLDEDDPRVFRLDGRSLDTLYRRAAKRAGVDAHFHDLRAEALTRMARRVDVLTLARIAGHRDIRSLSAYYRESATDIAARLD